MRCSVHGSATEFGERLALSAVVLGPLEFAVLEIQVLEGP